MYKRISVDMTSVDKIVERYEFFRESENSPLIPAPKEPPPSVYEGETKELFEVDERNTHLMSAVEFGNMLFTSACYPLEAVSLYRDVKPTALLEKIDKLLEDEEGDYDDEFLAPTQHAIDGMKSLVTELYKLFGDSLNFAKLIPNGKGGIEAVLRKGGRLLQLIAPPNANKNPYLFHKEGTDYKIEKFTDVAEASFWVKWLLEA